MYNKILLALLFFIMGCTPKIYNTPFINADETTHLEFGMTKDEVLNKLNKPLYVSYGDKDEIIWVYEVRTIKVQSTVITPTPIPFLGATIKPMKKADKSSDERHASPIHKLSITFSQGKLTSWEILDK